VIDASVLLYCEDELSARLLDPSEKWNAQTMIVAYAHELKTWGYAEDMAKERDDAGLLKEIGREIAYVRENLLYWVLVRRWVTDARPDAIVRREFDRWTPPAGGDHVDFSREGIREDVVFERSGLQCEPATDDELDAWYQ